MIQHLQNQTVTLYSKSSLNRYGRENVGSGETHRVRIQETTKSRVLPDGSTIYINSIAYWDPNVTIEIGDKVAYGSTNYRVFGKYITPGMQGQTHFIKTELTKWQST